MNTVKTIRNILVISALAFVLTACDQEKVMQQKIAYVDISTVLKESSVGKLEIEHNEKVKARLLSVEKDAEVRYKAMPSAQEKESRIADAQIINRQWLAEKRHARLISVQAIKKTVETYRQKQNIAMVLTGESIVAVDKGADISKKVIDQLKDIQVDYGELPVIKIKDEKNPTKKAEGGIQDTSGQN